MLKIIYTYLLTLPIIFIFDMLWVGVFAKDYYYKHMSPLMKIEFNWLVVPIYYLLFLSGLFIFAIYPGVIETDMKKTLVYAALFGFFCYMTYDLTNLSVVKDWPIAMSIIDIFWGMTLSTFSAWVAYRIYFYIL